MQTTEMERGQSGMKAREFFWLETFANWRASELGTARAWTVVHVRACETTSPNQSAYVLKRSSDSLQRVATYTSMFVASIGKRQRNASASLIVGLDHKVVLGAVNRLAHDQLAWRQFTLGADDG